MITVIVIVAFALSLTNVYVLGQTIILCKAMEEELPKKMDAEVEKKVYELLSRASFNWEAGLMDRSVHIRLGNGMVKKAEEVRRG